MAAMLLSPTLLVLALVIVYPLLSAVHPLEETGEAALKIHRNEHEGKIGILCLAAREGLGITDPEKRERIGEDKITLFRRHGG